MSAPWWPLGDPPLEALGDHPPDTRVLVERSLLPPKLRGLRPAIDPPKWHPGREVQVVDRDRFRVNYDWDQPLPLRSDTISGRLARQELWSKRDKTKPSRTLSGREALARLREKMSPEGRNFNQQVLDDRLSQGLPAGPQPPHGTETSGKPLVGGQKTSTPRQTADACAYVDRGTGQGYHLHHHLADDGSVGPASVEGCQQALEVINAGKSRVPPEHIPAVRAHLVRHLRDAGARVPRSIFEPTNARAAQVQSRLQAEQWAIEERIEQRQERLADLQDQDGYFALRDRRNQG